MCCCFFFFKQKTAYEMRISDWSSDVCSSDLVGDNVVVFGLGGIGLNVIQGARLAGAKQIIGVDINPDREEWGRKFGMTDFLNTKDMSREDRSEERRVGKEGVSKCKSRGSPYH